MCVLMGNWTHFEQQSGFCKTDATEGLVVYTEKYCVFAMHFYVAYVL